MHGHATEAPLRNEISERLKHCTHSAVCIAVKREQRDEAAEEANKARPDCVRMRVECGIQRVPASSLERRATPTGGAPRGDGPRQGALGRHHHDDDGSRTTAAAETCAPRGDSPSSPDVVARLRYAPRPPLISLGRTPRQQGDNTPPSRGDYFFSFACSCVDAPGRRRTLTADQAVTTTTAGPASWQARRAHETARRRAHRQNSHTQHGGGGNKNNHKKPTALFGKLRRRPRESELEAALRLRPARPTTKLGEVRAPDGGAVVGVAFPVLLFLLLHPFIPEEGNRAGASLFGRLARSP
ncbi:hypothetical protein HPB50_018685 [Hyalomma asiaticum]|uniref:Uncharacterized protein n=1 Tax=Hyalomma asiaticum TaxID=266040 RepID=A0ACB7SJE1_HYAAI|nr:hypothetical protein HPB50_018685 [Hyalomma asiaticum]